MALGISGILLAVFVANLLLGVTSGSAFLGDVGEMLLLFATSIAFVAAILKREADEKKKNQE